MNRIARVLLATMLISPLIVGCAEHRHTAVVYGTYGPSETVYYTQWETDSHREHKEYENREKREQKEYWEWRKHHHDHD